MNAKQPLVFLGMLGGAALAVWGVFMVFTSLASSEFIPGEDLYLRDIYVIIDQTLSMKEEQRREAKDILREEVLDVLGPGDRISCYRIASDFQESRDRVFVSSRRLPKVPVNVPGQPAGVLPPEVLTQMRQRWEGYERERAGWLDNLQRLEPPQGGFSDYLGTVNELARRITNAADPNLATGQWLLLIGDLKHEPVLPAPPAPQRDEKRLFADVNVLLVYPGGIHSAEEQKRVETFWTRYFADRGNKSIQISSYDGFIGRFPASRVAGN